jgi:hypothetical protein
MHLETEGLQPNPSSKSLLKLVTYYSLHVFRWSLTIMVFKASCEIGKRIKACLTRNFEKGVFVSRIRFSARLSLIVLTIAQRFVAVNLNNNDWASPGVPIPKSTAASFEVANITTSDIGRVQKSAKCICRARRKHLNT